MTAPAKAERLAEFFRRLAASPPCADGASARRQLADLLNAVEDELSGIPYDPAAAVERVPPDGRMYPPYVVSLMSPRVTVFFHIRHRTAIATNGAIRITLDGAVVLDKPGADGRTIDAVIDE